jgi:MFS family permease
MTTGDVAQARPRRLRWQTLAGSTSVILQDDDYRRLWLGRLCSHTALNAVLYTMLVLAVGEGGGTGIKSALFISAYLLPTATLGSISGVLVDRLPKNLLMCALNVIRLGLMVILVMANTDIWTIYGIALLIAMTSQFSGPAEAAALPHLVEPGQLTAANSANNFGGLISQIFGFAIIAPFFLNTVGERPLFAAAAILFGIGAFFFLTIGRLGPHDVDIDSTIDAVRDMRKQFAEAWETLGRNLAAYMSVIIMVLASTASLVAVTLMPAFVQDVLHVRVQNAIYVFLPAALGILAGLRLVHVLERRLAKGWVVGAGFGLLCVSLMCLSLTTPFARMIEDINLFGMFDPGPFGATSARIFVTIVASTAGAFSLSITGVASRSLVNETMPMAIQGRIFAAQNVLANLASIPPILLAGVLSWLFGAAPVMFVTVVILLFAAAWTIAGAAARQKGREHAATP